MTHWPMVTGPDRQLWVVTCRSRLRVFGCRGRRDLWGVRMLELVEPRPAIAALGQFFIPRRSRVYAFPWLFRCSWRLMAWSKENDFDVGGMAARAQPASGPENMKSLCVLDPDAALQLLETRLGRLHARLRLGIEREHEAQAFGQRLTFLHLENMPIMQVMIEAILRATGTYQRGRQMRETCN